MGQPILCLSESIERQLKQKRIERLLVSTTNDCDILLCIAAAVQSNKFSNFKPLGIGVDLMHDRTASGLFSDCSADVLAQVFFESELKYAAAVQDISFHAKSVSVKEAVFKSISEAFHYSAIDSFSKADIQIASYTEIEVLNISDEWIDTRLHGRLADIAKVLGVKKIYAQFVTGKNYFGAIAVSHG